MKNKNLDRITIFCKETWNNLSQYEKENYVNYTGILGFVEDCLSKLEIDQDDLTIADMDYLVDKMLACTDYEDIF